MGQKILLVNPNLPPSKRRKTAKGKTMAAKKRRTPAQIAATRKLVALNRARRKAPARKRNPVSKNATAYRTVARLQNPVKSSRRRRAAHSYVVAGAAKPRRRRNPIKPMALLKRPMALFKETIKSSLFGAAGAVGVDAVMGYLPLPDVVKTGYAKHATKGAISVILGAGAGMMIDKRHASMIASGGLTVALYSAIREFVETNVEGITLGDMGQYVSGAPQGRVGFYNAGYPAGGVGQYVSGGRSRAIIP